MVDRNALIIFVKNPIPGKVKTRLARTIGNENAAKVYEQLLAHTLAVTRHLLADKYVFYEDYVPEQDLWSTGGYFKLLQIGKDLGERLQHAFKTVFKRNYRKVIVIGSDCAQLTTKHIQEAFKSLNQHQSVIGPAKDGGYYLLGTTAFHAGLFQQIDWSSSKVLAQTITRINSLAIDYHLLEILSDVDDVNDLSTMNPLPVME